MIRSLFNKDRPIQVEDLLARPVEKRDSSQTVAFNQGCDARLRGLTPSDNPYHDSSHVSRFVELTRHDSLAVAWQHGWADVNGNWGKYVAGRWLFRPLVGIGEVGSG